MERSKVLERGLAVLEHVAGRQNAALTEVAAALGMSVQAASRALEALAATGFLHRDRHHDRYRLTGKLLALSRGHNLDLTVRDLARPLMAEGTRETGWPLILGKVEAASLVVIETTAATARYALPLPRADERMPYFTRAAGTICTVYMPAQVRADLHAQTLPLRRKAGISMDAAKLEVLLARARSQGFIEHDPIKGRPSCLAVALRIPGHDYGLEVCYQPARLRRAEALKTLLPQLKRIARLIRSEIVPGRVV